MSVSLGANGSSYNYPEGGDLSWSSSATNFASAVSAALTKLGLGSSLTANAVIDIISTTKGVYIPRMTTAQRDAIASPATGLVIYNTTLNTIDVYFSSAWNSIFGLKPSRTYSENAYANTSTSTSYADVLSAAATTWEVAITPKYSTSNINVLVSTHFALYRNASTIGGSIKIFRKIGAGSYSEIYTPLAFELYSDAGGVTQIAYDGRHNIDIQDSPATTSEVKYKLQYALFDSGFGATYALNISPGKSIIKLEEVF